MKTIIKNIKRLMGCYADAPVILCGRDMASCGYLDDAYVVIDGGVVEAFGPMSGYKMQESGNYVIDASERYVMPAFCDSHTHIVYAGSREGEYEDRIAGMSYAQIAERGGGILNSADRLHASTENELYRSAMRRVREMMRGGTGAVEIKSGYGLTLEDEMKMLRVATRIKEDAVIAVKRTFLGAHAFPRAFVSDRDGSVRLIVEEMIPAVASEKLADYIDVFCDEGFFTVEQTRRILERGLEYGLTPKIHANELAASGGVQVGVECGALSVDHLEHVGPAECEALRGSGTMATLLPGAAFFLGMEYAPARRMIDEGLAVALASDYNPGSSPSGSMKFVLSLASIKMRMTPVEAFNAATVNGAYAMGLSDTHGTITPGKRANVIITRPMPSFAYLSYQYTEDLIERVIFN